MSNIGKRKVLLILGLIFLVFEVSCAPEPEDSSREKNLDKLGSKTVGTEPKNSSRKNNPDELGSEAISPETKRNDKSPEDKNGSSPLKSKLEPAGAQDIIKLGHGKTTLYLRSPGGRGLDSFGELGQEIILDLERVLNQDIKWEKKDPMENLLLTPTIKVISKGDDISSILYINYYEGGWLFIRYLSGRNYYTANEGSSLVENILELLGYSPERDGF